MESDFKKELTSLKDELAFWSSVDFQHSEIPAWGPVIFRQLADKVERFVVEWELEAPTTEGEAA